jgi:hypothetical protein
MLASEVVETRRLSLVFVNCFQEERSSEENQRVRRRNLEKVLLDIVGKYW